MIQTVWLLIAVSVTVHNAGSMQVLERFADRKECERLIYEMKTTLTGTDFSQMTKFGCFEADVIVRQGEE